MILLSKNSWEIKNTQTKGRGIFATQTILPGVIIGDYLGKVINPAREDTTQKNGLYLLYYHDYASIYPEDVTKPGIHLLNHSCMPNTAITIIKGHTIFFALRKIFAGEEITTSYKLSPKNNCDPCTHSCFCANTNCTKTMHLTKTQFQTWNTYITAQAMKTKRMRIRYGKLLAQLPAYPPFIADHPVYDLFGSLTRPALTMNDTKLTSIPHLRKLIRTSGQALFFKKLNTTIFGIQNQMILTKV